MAQKRIKKPTRDIKISIYGESPKYLFDKLKEYGVPQNQWDKLRIEHDYSVCYYEDDKPSISVEGKIDV